MSAVSNIYLIIFLPLLASLLCQLLDRKFLPFTIAISSSALLLFFIGKAFLDVSFYKVIGNDFELSPISIALEFRLDIIGVTFLSLIVFLKTVILFYYRGDIEESLAENNKKTFYSVYLLNLFALVGIFTSNNLLNLFVFLEIYALSFFGSFFGSFFAISAISNDAEIAKSSFKCFCSNAAASLLILFCFLVIYLVSGDLNFVKISQDLQIIENKWFLELILLLLLAAFLIKFFPTQLHLKSLNSPDSMARFLAVDSLFIKTNIGIFVILKFIYFVFGKATIFKSFDFTPLVILISLMLIFYSAIKLYQQLSQNGNLKKIATYFCLNNIGFIIACMALKTTDSLQSLFFYILNFSLINLVIFIFAAFLERNFGNAEIDKISLIRKKYFSLDLPIKLFLFFIIGFPLSILFFANWYLACASMNIGFELFLLVALVASNFVQINFAVKLISAFSVENVSEGSDGEEEMPDLGVKRYQFYLLSFWFLVIAAYGSIFALAVMNNLSLDFALFIKGV